MFPLTFESGVVTPLYRLQKRHCLLANDQYGRLGVAWNLAHSDLLITSSTAKDLGDGCELFFGHTAAFAFVVSSERLGFLVWRPVLGVVGEIIVCHKDHLR